jgi:adenine phosphoribosyltransferase
MSETTKDIENLIRNVPDFPKKGIMFKDITPLLNDPKAFRRVVDTFVSKYKNKKITKVLSIESRGFLLAPAIALALNAGLVPVRKKGKLPYKTLCATYELEYGTDTLEMHVDAVTKGDNVLIVDDVLATGGTAAAVANMAREAGGNVLALAFLIELTFLNGKEKISDIPVYSLIKY